MNNNPQALRGLLIPIADPCDLYAEAALANLRWLAATAQGPEQAARWEASAQALSYARLIRWSALLGGPLARAGFPARRRR